MYTLNLDCEQADDLVAQVLLEYYSIGDLTNKERKAIRRVLSHFMIKYKFIEEFSEEEWDDFMAGR